MQRRFNQEMEEKAEAIRCIRYQSLINEQFGLLDKTKQKMDFFAYFVDIPQKLTPIKLFKLTSVLKCRRPIDILNRA